MVSELAGKGLAAEHEKQRHPGVDFGAWAGRIQVADDFEDTPQEILDALDEAIDPADR